METSALDYRSDTVTRPTAGMRAAMAAAEVGDDVFDEDPAVHRLQDEVAAKLGKEAALFVPSGTMSNQIGVRLHCAAGDEFICDVGCHIFNYEQAAHVQLSGISPRTVDGPGGVMAPEQLLGLIRPLDDHQVRTRLVCMENTHNRGGGCVLPYNNVVEITQWAHEHGLKTHLDGARLWNAAVATGIEPAQWAAHFDTVSVCFSKGLGAPIGSALVGPRDQIRQARRHRKLFGGGMRQAGILAAAASYALAHHVARLAEDHAHAAKLAEGISHIPGLTATPAKPETNIVIFQVAPMLGSAAEFAARLRARGLLVLPIGPDRLRAVTHLDLKPSDVERALDILAETAKRASPTDGPNETVRSSYA